LGIQKGGFEESLAESGEENGAPNSQDENEFDVVIGDVESSDDTAEEEKERGVFDVLETGTKRTPRQS
jgi:hypothetical protein